MYEFDTHLAIECVHGDMVQNLHTEDMHMPEGTVQDAPQACTPDSAISAKPPGPLCLPRPGWGLPQAWCPRAPDWQGLLLP